MRRGAALNANLSRPSWVHVRASLTQPASDCTLFPPPAPLLPLRHRYSAGLSTMRTSGRSSCSSAISSTRTTWHRRSRARRARSSRAGASGLCRPRASALCRPRASSRVQAGRPGRGTFARRWSHQKSLPLRRQISASPFLHQLLRTRRAAERRSPYPVSCYLLPSVARKLAGLACLAVVPPGSRQA
jgi:hypothetical protein